MINRPTNTVKYWHLCSKTVFIWISGCSEGLPLSCLYQVICIGLSASQCRISTWLTRGQIHRGMQAPECCVYHSDTTQPLALYSICLYTAKEEINISEWAPEIFWANIIYNGQQNGYKKSPRLLFPEFWHCIDPRNKAYLRDLAPQMFWLGMKSMAIPASQLGMSLTGPEHKHLLRNGHLWPAAVLVKLNPTALKDKWKLVSHFPGE